MVYYSDRFFQLIYLVAHKYTKKSVSSRENSDGSSDVESIKRPFFKKLQEQDDEQWTGTRSIKLLQDKLNNHEIDQTQFQAAQFKLWFKMTWGWTTFIALQIFLIWVIFLIASWNLGNVGYYKYSTPDSQKQYVWLFRLDQFWNMFSPHPPYSSWWYVMPGELVSGKQVELFDNGGLFTWKPNEEVNWGPPHSFIESFRSHRWFKFFENGFNNDSNKHLRLSFGRYICREFNKRHMRGDQLYKFDIYLSSHTTHLDGTKTMNDKSLLWSHVCFDQKPPYSGF
eukprot:TRINITY_DN3082_c2_g1_i1.p1 TRINITY_DN3082_c2_g1~~TRINITY_DN3082_c2_g1_i1.p1  ORF type:complete len:282 (-),score=32.00 TRINITY_DN3082_c2_g1_i1:78-923(-)